MKIATFQLESNEMNSPIFKFVELLFSYPCVSCWLKNDSVEFKLVQNLGLLFSYFHSSLCDINDAAVFVSQAILEFFQKFMDSVGSELEFKVDDITTGDPNAAGVTWHLGEVNVFPNSVV